ncbi:hypothetical protein [Streptomyces sp. MB09-01]|uniref:hypothetical protein n=1 Tax=Streptomyces sp. MB09-01 TaxID=3028666 RepID=UPI003A5BF79D
MQRFGEIMRRIPRGRLDGGQNIFFLEMGKERFGALNGMETFVRGRDATGAAVPENDLLAGLR